MYFYDYFAVIYMPTVTDIDPPVPLPSNFSSDPHLIMYTVVPKSGSTTTRDLMKVVARKNGFIMYGSEKDKLRVSIAL